MIVGVNLQDKPNTIHSVSSVDGVTKTLDPPKPGEVQQSISNVTGASENGGCGTSRQSVKGQLLDLSKIRYKFRSGKRFLAQVQSFSGLLSK
jgi:hypothetical protein